jgi:hypothetical protein
MRSSTVFALRYCTTLGPATALLTACFGSSSNSTNLGFDGGFEESSAASFDGASQDRAVPTDGAAVRDGAAVTDGPGAMDGGVVIDGADGAPLAESGGPNGGPDGGPNGPADGGGPVATFSTAPIDFGLVDCGSAPSSAKTYSFQNVGGAPLTYSASLGTGSVFSIQSGASGTVQPGATASIAIAAGTVPASSTAGTALTAVLTLTTNVPASPSVTVPVKVTPQGGSLTVSPSVAGFGQIQLSSPAAPIPLTITNTGNASIGLSLGAPTDSEFSVTYSGAPSTATLPASNTLQGAQAHFTPASSGMKTATVALVPTGVMCASPATAISLSGQGTTEPVTVAPSPVDFGTVNCGSAGAAQKVTITNGYGFAITYSTSLAGGAGSPFTLGAPSGTVPANGKASITVTPLSIPVPGSIAANAYGDVLTVTTNAPSVAPATVPLLQSASGAVLNLTMATTSFGMVNDGSSASLPFKVVNSGNANANLTVKVTGTGFAASFTGSATAGAGGGNAPGTATYTPPGGAMGAASGSLTVTSSGPVCGPAGTLSLSAQADAPVASFSMNPVPLASTCPANGTGANSTGAGSLTITNKGSAPLTISMVGASGFFTAQGPSASIAPGAMGTIGVKTNAPAGTAAGSYTGKLAFTTNEAGAPSYSVPLSLAVHGANLRFVDGTGAPLANSTLSVALTSSQQCPQTGGVYPLFVYGVQNYGDGDAAVAGPTNTFNCATFQNLTDANSCTVRFCGHDVNTCVSMGSTANGVFQQGTPLTVAASTTVTDTVAEFDEYNSAGVFAPCQNGPGQALPADMFTYATTGAAVCVPLPELSYLFNYGPLADCGCS